MEPIKKLLSLLFLASVLSACAAIPLNIEDRLAGEWDTDLAGFSVVFEYTTTTVAIPPHAPVTYSVEGDLITFEFQGPQTRRIEFLSRDVMTQTDAQTGITQTFSRRL